MKQLVPALFTAGAIMALTGAAVFITGWIYAPYIYTVGAGCIALAQVNTPVKGKRDRKVPGRLRREHQTSQRNKYQSGRHRTDRP